MSELRTRLKNLEKIASDNEGGDNLELELSDEEKMTLFNKIIENYKAKPRPVVDEKDLEEYMARWDAIHNNRRLNRLKQYDMKKELESQYPNSEALFMAMMWARFIDPTPSDADNEAQQ